MKRLTFLLCICLLLSLCGCFNKTPPPDLETVNKLYFENKEEIDCVVNFMINAEYYDMLISDSSNTMLTNSPNKWDNKLQTVAISDMNVQKAVKSLIDKNIIKAFLKANDAVQLQIWAQKEVTCYIACSLSDSVPSVEYATEEYRMDEDGLYYIIADYNEWRVRRREAGITRPPLDYGADLSYWDILFG